MPQAYIIPAGDIIAKGTCECKCLLHGGIGESRFSLRLGHGAVLTPHCGVIHPRAEFDSPLVFEKRNQSIVDALISFLGKDCDSNKSKGIVRFRNVSTKNLYDFNKADNMVIKCRKLFSRYPELLMYMIPNCMDFKLCDVIIVHEKACHITLSVFCFCVPFFSNFTSVFFIQNRIEDRLFRKSWRKFRILALFYQIQFGRTDRSEKNHFAHLLRFFIKIIKRITNFVKMAILYCERAYKRTLLKVEENKRNVLSFRQTGFVSRNA